MSSTSSMKNSTLGVPVELTSEHMHFSNSVVRDSELPESSVERLPIVRSAESTKNSSHAIFSLVDVGKADEYLFETFQEAIIACVVFFVARVLWRWRKASSKRSAKTPSCKPKPQYVVASNSVHVAEQPQLDTNSKLQSSPPATHVSGSSQMVVSEILHQLELHNYTVALSIYRRCEHDGLDAWFGEDVYSALVQASIRVGNVDVVEKFFRRIKHRNVQLSDEFWRAVSRLLSSRKHFTAIVDMYTMFKGNLPADKVIFSCITNAMLEIGQAALASSLLSSEWGEQVNLDVKDYVLHFRTYAAIGDVEAAENLFFKLKDDTSPFMLNLLLLTCVNNKEPERAARNLQKAHELEETKAERIADCVSYNTVMKGLAQCGMPEKCVDCLRNMLAHGLEPDDITCNAMLDISASPDTIEMIVKIFMTLPRKKNTALYPFAIRGLVRAGSLSKALKIYDDILAYKTAHLDIITYSMLIKALVDKSEAEMALKIFGDLRAAGLHADDMLMKHVLDACRYKGDATLGMQLFDDFVSGGREPSEYTLTTFLKTLGRSNSSDAYNVLCGWESNHGWKPTVLHYTCVMSGAVRSRNIEVAWQTYELMLARGVPADRKMFLTLVQGLVSTSEWDRIVRLVANASASKDFAKLPTNVLQDAVNQMMAAGHKEHGGLLRIMLSKAATKNVTPTKPVQESQVRGLRPDFGANGVTKSRCPW